MVRTIVFFLCVLLGGLNTYAQAPLDVANIELLINRHKKQHDRLEERNKKETLHHAITLKVKDVAEKYEKLHKDIMKKYSLASQWFNLGISAMGIVTELNELRKAIPPFVQYANKITNPYVLLKYVRAVKEIKKEIELCIKVSASIPALRLNAAELNELTELIKEHIYRLRYLFKSYAWSISGQVMYNQMFEKPTLPDYAKIANEVIQEYYKTK